MLCWTLLVLLGLADALPSEPFLLYSNITNIHAIDLNSFRITDIFGGLDRAVPLAIDTVNRHVYYGEHRLGYIFRTNYDGSSKKLILDDVKNVEGVAIDWIGRKIYWTMYKSGRIEVSTLDGKFRKVLVNTGLEYPRGMAIDPTAGYLFWSDWGAAAAIERCTLAGKERKALVRDNITWPNGMTIDYNAQRVYWIDAFHDTIYSIDYDGGQRKLIFGNSLLGLSQYHGFDLDIIGTSLYWSDWLSNAIFGLNITTGKVLRNISIPTTNVLKGAMGLVIVDVSRQPAGSSNCGNNNGGCEQLCFHTSSNFECACSIGMELGPDGKSCVDAFKDEFLMFADADTAKIYQMPLDGLNVARMSIPFEKRANISRPVALEFDPVEDRVYWTDVTLDIICRAFRNGSGFEVLHQNKVGTADGLTIDLAGRNLYWTSTSHNTIEVSRLNGSHRRVLIATYLREPRDIIVDPIDGFMYWSDWGIPKIERASMNGENRTELVTRNIRWVNGLTIDHVYNKLYWADAYEDTIEGMDLFTKQRKVILNKRIIIFGFLFGLSTKVNHPFGLTLLRDHIYWTDWKTDSVYRADVNTGANVKLLTGNLEKPMDIHAYSIKPRKQYRHHYTFSFPNAGSNFSCFRQRTCPQMDPAPACPPGYRSVRENSTCGLNCRDIVGYTYRCPCNDWMSCAVKERYLFGCRSGFYTSFRVRECVQEVKSGRCPGNPTQGSLTRCVNDSSCPGAEKCCNSKCTSPAVIGDHPCQQNNGGCDQLCFAVPGGHKCGCKNDFYYKESEQKCVVDTRPTTAPVTTPTPSGCKPLPAPDKGQVRCDGNPVPLYGFCSFSCNKFYRIKGVSLNMCFSFGWLFGNTTCVVEPGPKLSGCPGNILTDTQPGENFQIVSWRVPTASLKNGSAVPVSVHPESFKPPLKLEIGGPYNITYTAVSDGGVDTCKFSVTIVDREPPTFGESCPENNTYYTNDASGAVVAITSPVATDNSKRPPTISITGLPSGGKFPVGRSVIRYVARDEAGLKAECVFTVTVVISTSKLSSCPDDIVVDAEPKKNYRTVNWDVPRASLQNGSVVQVSVYPENYKPPMKFKIGGPYNITYTASIHGKMDMCNFSVTVLDREPPTFGSSCPANKTHYGDDVSGAMVNLTSPFATDNSKKPPAISHSGVPSGGKFPVGDTVIRYVARDEAGLRAECVFTVTIVNVCQGVSCLFGKKCSLNVQQGDTHQCVCDSTCPQVHQPVCGSDGVTYGSQCHMEALGCQEERRINAIVAGECGCKSLDHNEDFHATNNLTCRYTDRSVKCEVVCRPGTNSVFPKFLDIQCFKKLWIRKNIADKYVPLGTASPPRCYRTVPKVTSPSRCQLGRVLVGDVCVPCPPGTYHSQSRCLACDVTTYQDLEGQRSCKLCSDKGGTVTSTRTGAESCFFHYGSSSVTMTFNMELSKKALRQKLATDLTKVCERFDCSFGARTNRRRKRNTEKYVFKEEHIIIIKITQKSTGSSTTAVLLALDPKSTSLLPDEAFSSEDLQKMLFEIPNEDLPIADVNGVRPPQASTGSGGGSSSSKTPAIAGAVFGVIALIGIIFAIGMIAKRRTSKLQDVPPVQFTSDSSGGGTMHIGQPAPVQEPPYETMGPDPSGLQHGFVNHLYSDINAPPPYYDSSPVHKPVSRYELPKPNEYEIPDGGQAGALPAKDPLPPDAVVDVLPPKEGYIVKEDSLKADSPVKFFHKRGIEHHYETGVNAGERPKTPDADAELRLEPPPKFDGTQLQMMREKAATSILPNVPRKKKVGVLDDNENHGNTSHYQSVRDVTKEQSES